MLVATLTALQTANTGYDLRQVLAIDLPGILAPGLPDKSRAAVIQEVTRRIGELPGVERRDGQSVPGSVPWRDRGNTTAICRRGLPARERRRSPDGSVAHRFPEYFAVLGVPIVAGRDFTDSDRTSKELVAIVNQSVAQRLFPNGDALNRRSRPPIWGPILEVLAPAASSASSPTWMKTTSCKSRR